LPDPVTPNRNIPIQTHGSNVNTWDGPLNSGLSIVDSSLGAVLNISTTGGITGLNATQLQNGTISVTGALSSAATLAFPLVMGWWRIENLTTGNFPLVVGTSGAEVIAIPPGGLYDVQINGGTARFCNLPPVGSYLDLASSSIPVWIQYCTKAPYLLCDGSAFSGATFPQLAVFLGGTTLPDFRGRSGHYLNAGTSRLTTTGAGIDGNTLLAVGGANGVTLAADRIPSLISSNLAQSISVTSGATVPKNGTIDTIQSGSSGTPVLYARMTGGTQGTLDSFANNSISVTYNNASQQLVQNAVPGIMSGIRLIRAA
jgi:hypothetical protein